MYYSTLFYVSFSFNLFNKLMNNNNAYTRCCRTSTPKAPARPSSTHTPAAPPPETQSVNVYIQIL